jgi:hypothetical protein
MTNFIYIDEDGVPVAIGTDPSEAKRQLAKYVGSPESCEMSEFYIVEYQQEYDDPCLGYYIVTYPIGYHESLRYSYMEKFKLYSLEG